MGETSLKKTPLHSWHASAHAKLAPFAGFEMPISYPAGEIAEVKAVRTKAGLFDISHMGQIFVSGTAAREYLDFVSVRDLSPLKLGEARYTLACDHQGRPLDDLIIYRLPDKTGKDGDEKFMIVSNASNVVCIHKWLVGNKKVFKDQMTAGETLRVSFDPEKYAFFALQGPLSESIMQELVEFDELPQKNYSCGYLTVDAAFCIVMRSGYTGEDGFEILVPTVHAEAIWELLLDAGSSYGILPCGLAARDVLRLEAGMPLFGHEIDAEHDPISAGLKVGRDKPVVNFVNEKGEKRNFIGYGVLKKIADKEIVRPTLHAFVVGKGRIPRAGCDVYEFDENPKKIGYLTSAGPSPTLGKNIALGYLSEPYEPGERVLIRIGSTNYVAEVVKPPFYKRRKASEPGK